MRHLNNWLFWLPVLSWIFAFTPFLRAAVDDDDGGEGTNEDDPEPTDETDDPYAGNSLLKHLFGETEAKQPTSVPVERGLGIMEGEEPEPEVEEAEAEEEGEPSPAEPKAGEVPEEKAKKAPEKKEEAEEEEDPEVGPLGGKELKDLEFPELKRSEAKKAAAQVDRDPVEDVLDEDETDRLELARNLASLSDTHKDLPKKYLDWVKEVNAYTEKKQGEDADHDFDGDAAFQRLREKNPLNDRALRKLQKEEIRLEIEASSRADKDLMDRRLKVQEALPVIDKKVEAHMETLPSILPEAMRKVYVEEGPKAAKEQFPLYFEVAEQVTANDRKIARQFHLLASGLIDFDPTNNEHVLMDGFIRTECQKFAASDDPGKTLEDGRTFVTRDEFWSLKPEEQKKHWTLGNDRVMELFRMRQGEVIEAMAKDREARLKKMGYARTAVKDTPKAKAAPAKKAPAKRTGAPPAPRPNPTPDSPEPVKEGNALTRRLGLTT